MYFNSCWSPWDICGRSKLSTSCLNSGCISDVEILNKYCTWTSVRLERSFVSLMFMIEYVCSQMYADPNRTSSFMILCTSSPRWSTVWMLEWYAICAANFNSGFLTLMSIALKNSPKTRIPSNQFFSRPATFKVAQFGEKKPAQLATLVLLRRSK